MANWYEPDDEIKEAWVDWYTGRPAAVVAAAKRFPPWTLWRLDNGRGRRVFVRSFEEQEDGKITLTMIVSGQFNTVLMERAVFGIDPETLVEADLPAPDEVVGNMGISVGDARSMMKRQQN